MQVVYVKKSALDGILRFSKDKGFSIHNLQVSGSYDAEKPVYTAVISMLSRKFSTSDTLLDHARKADGIISADLIEI